MQKKLAGEGIGCFLVFMSSSSYPGFAARRVALLGGLLLGSLSAVSASGAIVGATLQQGTGPATPTSSDYTSAPTTAYVASYNFPTATATTVRFSFSNLFLFGGQFFNLTQLAAAVPAPGPYSMTGSLVSVELNVSLDAREPLNPNNSLVQSGDVTDSGNTNPGETWASDLVVLIAPMDGSFSNPLLQLGGGFTSFSASNWIYWSELTTSNAPYSFSDTQSISPSITLAAPVLPTDAGIWVGNGFDPGQGSSYGRWSGYLEFTFSGSSGGGSGVSDASRTGLLLAPGALLLLGLAGRARRRG
jgi:hypothetical protein